jgi:metal-dependent amidase/aminoacylase/carboxypeptidase family protein
MCPVGSLDIPLGHIGCQEGPVMAASDKFTINVKGKGGHGAAPQGTVDAIVEAAAVVTALQTVVSRNKVNKVILSQAINSASNEKGQSTIPGTGSTAYIFSSMSRTVISTGPPRKRCDHLRHHQRRLRLQHHRGQRGDRGHLALLHP